MAYSSTYRVATLKDKKKSGVGAIDSSEASLMKPAIQRDGTVSLMEEYENDTSLTFDQMTLLREIAETFSP